MSNLKKSSILLGFVFMFAFALAFVLFLSNLTQAKADNSNEVSTEIVTPIMDGTTDTGLELVGSREAKAGQDYEFPTITEKDDAKKKTIILNNNEFEVQGEANAPYANLAFSKDANNIKFRNLKIDTVNMPVYEQEENFTVSRGCTLEAKKIISGNRKTLENKDDKIKSKVIFSGKGNINVSQYITIFTNFVLDGPSVYILSSSQYYESDYDRYSAFYVSDSIDIKSGRVAIDFTGSPEPNTFGMWAYEGDLDISNNAEVFAVAPFAGLAWYKDANFNCDNTKLFCSSEIVRYTNRSQVTDKPDADYAYATDEDYSLAINETLAKTVYFKGTPPQAEKLDIVTAPTKTEYAVGEAFDKTGLELSIIYSDGDSYDYVPEDKDITGFDSSTPGDKTVTVSYSDEEANTVLQTSFVVTVKGETPEPEPLPSSPQASAATSDSTIPSCCLLGVAVLAGMVLIFRRKNCL